MNIIEVSEIISQINKELNYAQGEVLGEPRILLKSVLIELNTVTFKNNNGDFAIGILPINLNQQLQRKTSTTKKLKIELVPLQPTIFKGSNTVVSDLELGKFIIDSRREIQKGLAKATSLNLEKLEIEINIGIIKNDITQGKLSIFVFSFDGKNESNEDYSHSIKIVFENDPMP